MVNVADVILTSHQDLFWTFSGLNVYISHCELNSLDLQLRKSNDFESTTEMPTITFYNSSFKSLDLNPETKAEINDCYIDAKNESRPTLIKANNSDILIKKSEFLRFVNKNTSTILNGENNCNVSVENTVFTGHQGHLGVLYIHDHSSMKIRNTTFNTNTAEIAGGAISVESHSKLSVTDCYFYYNAAKYGGGGYVW